MVLELSTVKGFQDFLPPESLKRDAVRTIIQKWFKLYGFLPIETPFVEYDELMKPQLLPSEQEDEAISDRFRLKDRAGRNLGLRYEFTFQLQRIFKENPNLKLPFRRYQIGENFRDEPIGAGRFRQFTQCDADIIGDSSMQSDAEVLALFSDILAELNIEFEIQVNNRKLLQSIIESVQIDKPKQVMRELDKIDKLGIDEVKLNLRKYATTNQIITLLKLFEKNIEFFKENAFDGIDEITTLMDLCNQSGVQIKFNPFLARGFSYYTGNVFEIKQTNGGTIAGGGRYDKSVGRYVGREIPAVGISFGLERVCSLATVKVESIPKVLIISIGEDASAIKLAKSLRKSEISCIVSTDKVGKSLEYANAYSVPFALFLGEDEVQKKKVKLRDLANGEETYLTEAQLIKKLENN